MSKRHVAKSGKSAGQLVACRARNCRNGGRHYEDSTFLATQAWLSKKSGVRMRTVDITEQDVLRYLAHRKNQTVPSLAPFFARNDFLPRSAVREPADSNNSLNSILHQLSQKWEKTLTEEEREAITWFTNHDSRDIYNALSYQDASIQRERNLTPEQQEELSQTHTNLKTAIAKAPILKEPIILYRGLNPIAFNDAFYDSSDSDIPQNLTLEQKARIARDHFPVGELDLKVVASTSASPEVARTFAEETSIVMEIKTRQVASVTAMSRYSQVEQEVILSPEARYQVAGIQTSVPYRKRNGSIAHMVIVQVEEVE